jgi:hypothetical protein
MTFASGATVRTAPRRSFSPRDLAGSVPPPPARRDEATPRSASASAGPPARMVAPHWVAIKRIWYALPPDGPAPVRRASPVLAVLTIALASSGCRGRRGAPVPSAQPPQVARSKQVLWRTGTRGRSWPGGTIFAVGAPKGEPAGPLPPGPTSGRCRCSSSTRMATSRARSGHDRGLGPAAACGSARTCHDGVRRRLQRQRLSFSGAGGTGSRVGGCRCGPPVDSGGRLYVGGTGLKASTSEADPRLPLGSRDLLDRRSRPDGCRTLFAATTHGGRCARCALRARSSG